MSTRNNAFCCWFTLLHDIEAIAYGTHGHDLTDTVMATAVIQRFSKQRHINTEDKRLWIVSMSPLVRCQRKRFRRHFQGETSRCNVFFFSFQSNPRYGTTWHVSEEAIRGRQWEYSCTKKSFTTHKTSNEKERYLNDSKKCRRHVTDRSIHSSSWQWLQYQNKWYKSH
jgi:hypothetical protein